MSAAHQKDAYKIGHHQQYPDNTSVIYANFTARSGKLSNVPDSKGIVFVGGQHFYIDYLIEDWNQSFFNKPIKKVVAKYQRRVSNILGYTVDVSHIEELHKLGYLPVVIKSLPEGSFVPYGVPMLTIKNTIDKFFWVTNMLESVLSAELWQMITSATTYTAFKKLALKYADLTGSPKELIPYNLHDFSFRGMCGRHAAAKSGFAVLAAGGFGTDCIPAIDLAEDYYGSYSDIEIVGVSVNATEHSVMCSGGKDTELETYRRLITEIYPDGFISIVSDSWDFWKVVSEYLVILKPEIMARDGKVIIRPDSGNPVDIICGIEVNHVPDHETEYVNEWIKNTLIDKVRYDTPHGECGVDEITDIFKVGDKYFEAKLEIEWNRYDKQYYYTLSHVTEIELTPAQKGLVECLWDTFGGTLTDNGFKVLDSHIGAIYGDSITYDRADRIFKRLMARGFASINIVLGLGSYAFQYVTRDTHGIAMKTTYAVIDGVGQELFKDPITDDGTKKSAKGLLMVVKDENDNYKLIDQVSSEQEEQGCLEEVFRNSQLIKEVTLADIRAITALNI